MVSLLRITESLHIIIADLKEEEKNAQRIRPQYIFPGKAHELLRMLSNSGNLLIFELFV